EIYLLSRNDVHPFEVMHAIPLKRSGAVIPWFGDGSPGAPGTPEEKQAIGRTAVVCALPSRLTDTLLRQYVDEESYGKSVARIELLVNPLSGHARTCALLEFTTPEAMREVWEKKGNSPLPQRCPDAYLRPLYRMAYGDVLGGCCTLSAVKQILQL